MNVITTSGAPLYASAACAATASNVSVTSLGQVLETGVNQKTMCAIGAIYNDGAAWASSSSYEQVSWNDNNPNSSPSEWWSDASSDVLGERQSVCATLPTLGYFYSPGFVEGTSTSWQAPPGLTGGGLCGLTFVKGDFKDNSNGNDGVFLTLDVSTGAWTLTASSGMQGDAYCVW
jgi:hypothetical protein